MRNNYSIDSASTFTNFFSKWMKGAICLNVSLCSTTKMTGSYKLLYLRSLVTLPIQTLTWFHFVSSLEIQIIFYVTITIHSIWLRSMWSIFSFHESSHSSHCHISSAPGHYFKRTTGITIPFVHGCTAMEKKIDCGPVFTPALGERVTEIDYGDDWTNAG